MRSIFISWLAVISPWFASAQPDTPSVFNTGGFELSVDNSSITISIGETAITTITSSSALITQGYLQPIDREPCNNVTFTYYPNPAKDFLNIEVLGCDDEIASVQIIDLWGRTITNVNSLKDNQVFLGDLSQGLYVLKVLLKGGTRGSFSAVKVTN